MVVADQSNWQADVVVVIEGTANLSPYFESLKTNYIIPTLEYFNGGPADDRDCGCDTNCTMYALVVFMAADCAPETAATVFGPTPSTHKFLSWLEKIKFIGGGGESHSHIAEGLSTALQVFDDFHSIRDNNITTQKHCILITNSAPYPLPALESAAYSGLMTEQLAAMMAERHINFSILSLRKIPQFYKIYEKAGGDMQQVATKNYAKDSRHCILLRGYQLQERPISPPLTENKTSTTSVCSPPSSGQKRPATNSPPHPREATGFKQPATQNNYSGLEWPTSESQSSGLASQNPGQSSLQAPSAGQSPLGYGQTAMPSQPNQAMPQRPGIPTPPSHLNNMNQPNPPNVTITNKGPPQHSEGLIKRGHSPVPNCGPRMSWNQAAAPSPPASTPPNTTTSVLANQLNMGPSNMPMRLNAPQIPLNQTVSNIVSQAQSTMSGGQNVLNAGNIRGNIANIGLRMSTTSSGPMPMGGSNPLVNQLGQHQGFVQTSQAQLQQTVSMSNSMPPIQSKMGNSAPGNQLMSSQGQTMTTTSSTNMPLQSVPGNLPMSQGASQQGQQPTNPIVTTKDRRTIWQGKLEFQEKTNPQQVQGQRVTHTLACTFSSMVNDNGEPDVNADKWPNKLMLQLIPRQLIVAANLFAILKTAAKHVLIHFTQDCEALSKLCKSMSSSLVGCVQFPGNCDIRIMVVLYMPDKRIYMGFIANDQEAFYNNIRQMYDNHRKQQQQKQRMLAGNVQQPENNMPVQPSTNSNANMMIPQQLAPGNINPNANQMNARMPINQPQIVPQNNAPPSQTPANNNGMVHSSNMNAQSNNAARLSHLEAARQQNLLKIQQLQQTLEAAQQKELQYKAAQEQQQQVQQQQQQQQQAQQQQQMMERQNAIRQLQQQLAQQQQQLAQQQQSITMQQISQQNSHNPQLRNLLQQDISLSGDDAARKTNLQESLQERWRRQQVQQLRRQQIQQNPMMMQHPQGMRQQIPGNNLQGGMTGMASNVGQQQQQPQQQTQQAWGDLGMLDSIP